MPKKKVPERQPVTWRATVQRLNRKLEREGAQLRSSVRGGRWNSKLGPYYIVENGEKIKRRFQTREEVVEFARVLDVIAAFEAVGEGGKS